MAGSFLLIQLIQGLLLMQEMRVKHIATEDNEGYSQVPKPHHRPTDLGSPLLLSLGSVCRKASELIRERLRGHISFSLKVEREILW